MARLDEFVGGLPRARIRDWQPVVLVLVASTGGRVSDRHSYLIAALPLISLA
jgi:hypothetical protein